MRHATSTSFAALLAGLLLLAAPAVARSGGGAATTTTAADPAMPAMLRLAVTRGQTADVAASYHLNRAGRGANPRHSLELAFTAQGARVDGPAGGFALHLQRFGRGDGRPVRRAAPRIDGAWVEYDRGSGLTEWFVNVPRGVEQGWTVAERPAGRGPLVLELDTASPPERSDDGRLAWSGLVYHRLVALDADGRELPAAWAADGTRLRIEVNDRDAVYPLLIDPWVEQAKLTADDGAANRQFGVSVALAGDTALVGASSNPDVGAGMGATYVFIRSGDDWSQQARLTAADGTDSDQFGAAVALAGDTALVGAVTAPVGDNGFQGAAYVFTRSDGEWSQQAKLTADDGANVSFFGRSVALSGDTALVGAPFAEVDGTANQGAAYVFTASDEVWSQRAKLAADDGAGGDEFGVSVALVGDTALVGSHGAEVGGNEGQGAAYVFTGSGETWTQQARLTADDGAAGDQFGISVALAGDTALVGAWSANVDGPAGQGEAYVFTGSDGTWSQQAKLTAADGSTGDLFGASVALVGDTAVVGAPGPLDVEIQSAAYLFTESDGAWSQQAKLTAADGMAGDLFGVSVALGGDTSLVGAPFATVDGNVLQGAAYVFAAVEPVLGFEPAQLDFGEVELGSSAMLPATLHNTGDGDATVLDFTLAGEGFGADTTGCGFDLPAGGSCTIDVTFAPTATGPATGTLSVASAEGATAELGLAGNGVDETGVFAPTALEVDPEPLTSLSDGNRVFEPGEWVEVVPGWRNDGAFPQLLDGTASAFTGPAGPVYTPVVAEADYDEVDPGETATCKTTGLCYQLEIGPPGVPRPATHWDAVFDETLSDETVWTWTLHIGDSFTDVPRASLFYRPVETLLHHGVSGDPSLARLQMPLLGCSETEFCPAAATTRAEVAVFLLKGLEGGGFDPQDCVSGDERFDDVPAEDPFCPWIEELAVRGVTAGCGGNDYCPTAAMTRAQIAVFLLRTLEGPDYVPPECSGVFDDVTCPSLFADWIEDLFARGLTAGCGGGHYCPDQPITRSQMAAFVVRTFGLVLYGP